MEQRPKYLSGTRLRQTRLSGKSVLFNYREDGVKDQAWQSQGPFKLAKGVWAGGSCRKVGNAQGCAQLRRTPEKKGVHDFSRLHEKAK